MWFQKYICLILFLLVEYGKALCSTATSSSNTQMLPLEKNIFQEYGLFCYRFIAFTLWPFVFVLLFVNNR